MALTDLLQQRYGDPSLNPDLPWNDLLSNDLPNNMLASLLSHRSIRAYKPDPLPTGTLESLVAAAQSASTSSNLQTWSVVAIESPERKDRLAQLAGNQAQIRQCPLFLLWLADLARLSRVAEGLGQSHDGLDYLEMFVTAIVDAALAAQNAVVAAESLGLGTVYIGAMRNHPEEVAKVLNLPPQVFTVFGLCVGYPDPAKPAAIKPRLPQPAVLHRETYGLTEQDEAIAHYNDTMKAFYAEQKMDVSGSWSEHSTQRIASATALSGRDRLKEALSNLGFLLR